MPDTLLERLQNEVTENGKDIRELQTEMKEMKLWRDNQSGKREHIVTWTLATIAIIAEIVGHYLWGK